ncbi:unnamed protein product [Diplocarpon coronariae]
MNVRKGMLGQSGWLRISGLLKNVSSAQRKRNLENGFRKIHSAKVMPLLRISAILAGQIEYVMSQRKAVKMAFLIGGFGAQPPTWTGTRYPTTHVFNAFTTYHASAIDEPLFFCEKVLFVTVVATESRHAATHPQDKDARVAGKIVIDMRYMRDEGGTQPTFTEPGGFGVVHSLQDGG